jgi:hypothetical protein
LPKKDYVIYGSGPLGIRRIRKIHDLDKALSKIVQKISGNKR